MRYYAYYPGCAMESEGVPIEMSLRAVGEVLGFELKEMGDWTCCGCPGAPIHELDSIAIASRNLALAEKTGLDLVAPCSCCYRNLKHAHIMITQDPKVGSVVAKALGAINLSYNGGVRVRHLMDVLINDIGLEAIASKVKVKLHGLKAACWYGCHETRPFGPDDFDLPKWLDMIVEAVGGEPVDFPLKAQCCGGAQLISQPRMALKLVWKLLDNATDNGAACMVTTLCPLCHSNMDANQGRVNRAFKSNFHLPVIASTQLLGIAFGVHPRALGLDKNIVPWEKVLAPYVRVSA